VRHRCRHSSCHLWLPSSAAVLCHHCSAAGSCHAVACRAGLVGCLLGHLLALALYQSEPRHSSKCPLHHHTRQHTCRCCACKPRKAKPGSVSWMVLALQMPPYLPCPQMLLLLLLARAAHAFTLLGHIHTCSVPSSLLGFMQLAGCLPPAVCSAAALPPCPLLKPNKLYAS
jgi:hypothetical protein